MYFKNTFIFVPLNKGVDKMTLSYDYEELIEDIKYDIDNGKSFDDVVYIKRKKSPLYNPIVDYGYDKEEFINKYGNDIEETTICEMLVEMDSMDSLI